MTKLSTLNLDKDVIDSLAILKVYSVADFIKTDADKLASSCLTFKEIIDLKEELISREGKACISGLDLYNNCIKNSAVLPTGIKGLDVLLNGGIETGTVNELFGLSGSGKSQICFSVAANVSFQLKRRVLYFDTKNDFSAQRIHAIISNKTSSVKEVDECLSRIEVVRVGDMHELVSGLCELQESLATCGQHDYRLIVLDSITSLYLPYIGTKSNEGWTLLNQVSARLKEIAQEAHVGVLLTNLGIKEWESELEASSRLGEASCRVGEASSGLGEGSSRLGEVSCRPGEASSSLGEASCRPGVLDLKPALGRYWTHVPHTRILVHRESSQCSLTLSKSLALPLALTSKFQINEHGVT